jgi:flagellar basal-body rod protein FlgB
MARSPKKASDRGIRDREEESILDFLSSNSMLMLEKSMGFLWTKQAAVLDNIANAETPDYKAKVVTFEEGLRDKLEQASQGGNAKQAVRQVLEENEFAVTEAQEATRMDDNGVNITDQMVELVRTAYQQQYVMQSISSQLSILRTAIKAQ